MSDLRKQLAEKSKAAREESSRRHKEQQEALAKQDMERRKKKYAELHARFLKLADQAAVMGLMEVDIHDIPREEMKLIRGVYDSYYTPTGNALDIATYFRELGFQVDIRSVQYCERDDYGSLQPCTKYVLRVSWED